MSQAKQINWVNIIKESSIAAFITFMLALPLAALKTNVETNEPSNLERWLQPLRNWMMHTFHMPPPVDQSLSLAFRFNYLIWPIVIVFVGRIIFALCRDCFFAERVPAEESWIDKIAKVSAEKGDMLCIVMLLMAIALPFMPFSNRYVIDVATSVLIYVMLGWGLNIVVGLAGLLDLGYVAFYAVGAYSFALLSLHFHFTFWMSLPLAGLFAGCAGILLGFPVLRLRGDYLAIVTLGFGEIIRLILLNWVELTNGPDGISGIPRPTFFGLELKRRAAEGHHTFSQFFNIDYASEHRVIFLYFIILVLASITNVFTQRIRKLPVGRAWEALREDEIACRSLGINPTNTKLTACAIRVN